MASIRKLKKDINYLAYEILTEVFTYKHFHPELKEKKLDDAIAKIIKIRTQLITRVNDPLAGKDKTARSAHYRTIQEEMVTMIEVLEELST